MRPLLVRLVGVLLGAGFLAALVTGADVRLTTAFIIALTVFLWATLSVPEYFTALLFVAVVLVFGVAGADTALAGFKSKAVWLVFAGMVFGAAIQKHSMGGAVFDRVLGKLRSYRALVWTVAGFALALSFVIPSAMGRVVLLAPLVAALCDRLALGERSVERTGVYLGAIAGATVPAFTILTSNVPNVVLLGAMETAYGRGISYGDYFQLNFPVLGLGAFLLLPVLVQRLFPGAIGGRKDVAAPAPWSRDQRWLMALLAVTLVLWGTDNLHGIPAAWVGLAAAVLCLAPGVGIVPPATLTTLNFGPWFFVAGAIGLGAVVRDSGLGLAVWNQIAAGGAMAGWPPPLQYAALVLGTMAVAVFTTLPAAPAVFTPLAGSIAQSIGWTVDGVIQAQIPSFVIFALPYQAPPVLVGMILLKLPLRAVMKLFAVSFLFGVVVLIPLHYVWGRYLGYFR